MTDTGDHGGESQKETDAALFLYSSSRLFPSPDTQVRYFHRCTSQNSFQDPYAFSVASSLKSDLQNINYINDLQIFYVCVKSAGGARVGASD